MSKSNETTPNVPTLRFKSFEQEWEYSTIGKCSISLEYGMNAAAVKYDGKHKYIRITDIDEETSAFIPNPLSSPDGEFEQKYLVKENDILFARTGASVGKSYLYNPNDGELYFAGFLIRARIKPEYNGTFIYYQTKSKKYDRWVKLTSMRSGQPGINSQEYSCYPIAITGKVEQDKIADFLQMIDNRIAVQNKIISKYETLIKGISCDYFSKQPNHIAKLKDLIIKGKAGGTPSSTVAEYYNGDIPFLSISDMTKQGKYVEFTEKHISENGLANSSAWIVPSNSLILSMYASVGLVCINKVPLATSQAMFSMMLKDCDMLDYIYYYLNFFRETQIHRLLETGTQSNINADTVRDIEIPFYSNILVFVKTLQAIENRLNNEKDMLSRLMNLKTYLLSSLFI